MPSRLKFFLAASASALAICAATPAEAVPFNYTGAAVDYVLAGELGGHAKPTLIKDGCTGKILRGA